MGLEKMETKAVDCGCQWIRGRKAEGKEKARNKELEGVNKKIRQPYGLCFWRPQEWEQNWPVDVTKGGHWPTKI